VYGGGGTTQQRPEADALADAYLGHGIIGPGSRSDARHVALATIGRVDVLVSWNFRHIVNLGRSGYSMR
jgi:hypothetical protein